MSTVGALEARRVPLAGELTVNTAADQFERLRSILDGAAAPGPALDGAAARDVALDGAAAPGPALDGAAALRIDLSGVTELDTAGLQLLLFARREAERLGIPVTFHELSQPVTDALAIAHLVAEFTDGSPGDRHPADQEV